MKYDLFLSIYILFKTIKKKKITKKWNRNATSYSNVGETNKLYSF